MINRKTLLSGLMGVALCVGAGAEQTLPVRTLAASCSACHGISGMAPQGLPSLAGQPREALLQKLRAFQADSTPGALMPQLSRGYSDAQLEQLAAYFSNPKP